MCRRHPGEAESVDGVIALLVGDEAKGRSAIVESRLVPLRSAAVEGAAQDRKTVAGRFI